MRLRTSAFAALLALAGCASAAAQSPAGVLIVRGEASAGADFSVGATMRLTPPGHAPFAQLRLVEHANYRTPLHVHHETDETFLVLQGELTLFADAEQTTLRPGDYAFIPRGTPHAQGNVTDRDAVVLMTLVPGAFSDFFDARADLVRETPPEHPDYGRRMRALGERFDIEIVGDSPF